MKPLNYKKRNQKLRAFYFSLFIKKLDSSYRFLSLLLLLTFVASFQNCYFDYSEGQSTQKSQHSLEGIISAHLSTENEDRDKFPTHTNVVFTFENIHPQASEVHWNINRGFESIKNNAKGNTEIQYSFSQAGTYDISATSYKNVNDFLTPLGSANKRVVIGDQCDAGAILEIVLTSGSLVAGQTATFGIKNESQFSSLSWKATLPSGSQVNAEGNSIQVSFSEENAGTLKVEVSGSQTDQNDCVTYRSKEFDINNTLTPHFSEVKIVDENDNNVSVTLENNNIYKYEKTSNSRFVFMNIKNAHRCILKEPLDENGDESSIICEGGKVDITLDSHTQCNETIIKVRAEHGTQKSGNNYEIDPQISSYTQETYYNYCGANADSCYFGPLSVRPDDHTGCCSGDNYSDNSNCSHPKPGNDPDPGFTPDTTTTTTTTTQDPKLCPPGDTYLNNPNCVCDSSTRCCPGDTYRDNPNHCVCDPATDPEQCQTDCVKEFGSACCKTNEGGTCTGPFCTTFGACSNKWNCHVVDIGDGICRPSCGHLAVLQNTGHYGPDGIRLSCDDPHHYTGTDPNTGTTCSSISGHWGSNWEKIPLIDGVETWEVTKYGGGECCKRIGSPPSPNDPVCN